MPPLYCVLLISILCYALCNSSPIPQDPMYCSSNCVVNDSEYFLYKESIFRKSVQTNKEPPRIDLYQSNVRCFSIDLLTGSTWWISDDTGKLCSIRGCELGIGALPCSNLEVTEVTFKFEFSPGKVFAVERTIGGGAPESSNYHALALFILSLLGTLVLIVSAPNVRAHSRSRSPRALRREVHPVLPLVAQSADRSPLPARGLHYGAE